MLLDEEDMKEEEAKEKDTKEDVLFAIYKTVCVQSTSHDACVFAGVTTKIFLDIAIDCVLRKELKKEYFKPPVKVVKGKKGSTKMVTKRGKTQEEPQFELALAAAGQRNGKNKV